VLAVMAFVVMGEIFLSLAASKVLLPQLAREKTNEKKTNLERDMASLQCDGSLADTTRKRRFRLHPQHQ